MAHAFGSFHSLSINSLSQLAVNKLLRKPKLKMKTTVVLCTGQMFSVLPQPFFMLYTQLTKPHKPTNLLFGTDLITIKDWEPNVLKGKISYPWVMDFQWNSHNQKMTYKTPTPSISSYGHYAFPFYFSNMFGFTFVYIYYVIFILIYTINMNMN